VASICVLLALGASSAWAEQTREQVEAFGSFGWVGGLAVDTSGDVYVADIQAGTVQKYDASGNPVNFTGSASYVSGNTLSGTPSGSFSFSFPMGIAVDNSGSSASAGDIYVLDPGNDVVDKFGSDGTYLGQVTGTPSGSFSGLAGIGVDGAGNLYVYQGAEVDEFDGSASNAFIESFPNSNGGGPGLAVDSGGDFYPMRSDLHVEKFDSSGTDLGEVDAQNDGFVGLGVAVDPATGHVLVDDLEHVDEWDTSAMNSSQSVPGTLISQFGAMDNGSENASVAIAVSPVSGDVYVSDRQGQVEIFGPLVTIPDVTTGSVSSLQPTSATLNGSVDPAGGGSVTSCQFEYVDDADYNVSATDPYSAGGTASCSPSTPYASATPVSADISNLQPNTTYHYRLDAGNANGLNETGDATFRTPGPPTIDGTAATNASSSSVSLTAQINPQGSDTTYHFEYGTSTSYGTSLPTPDGDIGSGSSDVQVSQTINGLTPGVDYHFRVVATSSLGTARGPDRVFAASPSVAPVAANSANCPNAQYRSGPSASLPDCRAYELVTPADKSGSSDLFGYLLGDATVSSNDGNRALLISSEARFGPHPGPGNNTYVFSRGSTGWTTTNGQPAGAGGTEYWGQVFSPDLTNLAMYTTQMQDADSNGNYTHDALVAGPAGGPYTQVTGPEPILAVPSTPYLYQQTGGTNFVGATPDFSHLLLESEDHTLAPGASGQVAASASLYDWSAGKMQLVNVNSDGSLTSQCGARLGDQYTTYGTGLYGGVHGNEHAISSDGSKIFFVSPDPTAVSAGATDPSCSQPSELYMRDAATNKTVDISCPASVPDPGGCQTYVRPNNGVKIGAQFVGASADGSKVFFITTTELTADDTGHAPELYEYDTGTGALTRVSRGVSGTATGNVDWATVSNDGSTVYFGAAGDLAPGATPQAGQAGGGYDNLYHYDTSTGATSYVATIDPDANNGAPDEQFIYTTPNGQFLLFESSLDVTGYQPGPHSREVYRYDAADGSVLCVSCNPSGISRFSFDAGFFQAGASFGALDPELQILGASADPDGPRPEAMSDDGQYVFFETPDQLVPQDTNTPSCTATYVDCGDDVYEWHGGQVSLISSGTSSLPSYFIGSSPSGRDVFFATHSQLVSQDTDSQGDIYDARIGGGFPPSSSPPDCSGDGCQGQLSPSPVLPPAATVTFSGPGNATPGGRAAKVRVLRKAVHGARFVITVKVPAAGKLSLTGASTKTLRRAVSRAGSYRLTLGLTGRARHRLRGRGRLRVVLRVRYLPRAGRASSVSVAFTVKR
jgi:hypothetical protein